MNNTEALIQAFEIYNELLSSGEISRKVNPELYNNYQKGEVADVLSTMQSTMHFSIYEIPSKDKIYMMPDKDNLAMNYTNEQMRRALHSEDAADTALKEYICCIILFLFFGGNNLNNPIQAANGYITVKKVVEEVDERTELYLKYPEKAAEFTEDYEINYYRIAEKWQQKKLVDQVQNGRFSSKTKEGIVKAAAKFLQEQKLVVLDAKNNRIKYTERGEDLFCTFYLNAERVRDINDIFELEHMYYQQKESA